jgi:hypothetical protein
VQERALRFVYDDYTSSYINLLLWLRKTINVLMFTFRRMPGKMNFLEFLSVQKCQAKDVKVTENESVEYS